MKFLKYIVAVILLVSIGKTSSATSTQSGYGCMINGSMVYTDKLGTTDFYGNDYDVYNSNGQKYAIDYNNAGQCDQIQSYNAQDMHKSCWVNNYVNPTNNQSGAAWGNTYRYTVTLCTPMNLPLDDYTWAILLVVGGLGAFYISKKGLLLS